MKQVHVLMEFTPHREHLLESWQNYLRRYRLTSVAQSRAVSWPLWPSSIGMLQFDTWTRGYYTQRLLWGVPAAIIAIAAVVLFAHLACFFRYARESPGGAIPGLVLFSLGAAVASLEKPV